MMPFSNIIMLIMIITESKMWIDMYIFWTAILLSLENNVGDAVDAVDAAAAAVSESFARSFHGLWMDHNDATKSVSILR